ncbi:bifunctional aspartate kinase/homoserine dehydrogenase [Chloropicon primus]|uniref:Bifunctional aspartate kinase/homoserine dehydrogenase n=1 Tax=Chloropicon primus TaxID=1764295 RepID=A0A5B8MWN4_9CHLO|nr:bifunctional aspartate kinase/homoserine dehydrogenase [Chloropicon primus]UPR03193.1 bifunctional aspartate kinase/homoserine dehydrogenase [Chloropicon primus]|eukprot:QDZ23982.1 bifunctional aspartate kinase/homoserine dehydrogenase [Chloropicon primus]
MVGARMRVRVRVGAPSGSNTRRHTYPQRNPRSAQEASGGPDAEWRAKGKGWTVWKFGGTCVAGPDRLVKVAELLKKDMSEGNKLAVVLSAMGSTPEEPVKVTDQLLRAVGNAADRSDDYKADLERLEEMHIKAAMQLLGDEAGGLFEEYVEMLKEDIKNLKSMLKAVTIVGVSSSAFSDFVVGHGELWNARLFTAFLRTSGLVSAKMVDARDVLVVEPSEQDTVEVDYVDSARNLDAWYKDNISEEEGNCPIVVTGFIAKRRDGRATTLRRNGSDYSGTIMAALLNADSITIWTDVDGVYSADPRKVNEAEPLKHLSYNEAWELSYFGANVLHPRSTIPAMSNGIPIRIKNFFNVDARGTLIDSKKPEYDSTDLHRGYRWNKIVKGFATIDDCSLINIEGTGMVGVPGTASKIFSTIRDAGINVIMISQGSSEHSVCFAVKSSDARLAQQLLKTKFDEYIQSGLLDDVSVLENCTMLAAVGSNLQDAVGAAAHMFAALSKSRVNIRAIAQGCSEHNITVVIDSKDAKKALECVHSAFYLSDVTVAVGLVGPGLVGKTLLEQFNQQLQVLKKERGVDIRVCGIASSKKMLLSDSYINLDTWEEDFEKCSRPSDLTEFKDHLLSCSMPIPVIVDCTASDYVSDYYQQWMESGVHVITPNKKVNSGPLERYNAVKKLQEEKHVHYFYEATVGAGLPVIATIKHLMDTGDHIKSVEGIFSGTLSYIFNNFKSGTKFSDIVKTAKENGFTEPDPRDDLSGTDVARKVTTLARESGVGLELSDIPVESLVPKELESCSSSEEFMQKLPEFDDQMTKLQEEAAAAGEVLRYVGSVDVATGKGTVSLKRYPESHPFAQLNGTDNIILCVTDRYDPQPLVITGPGAGAEVTAGGVFSDLIRLCSHFGAPS